VQAPNRRSCTSRGNTYNRSGMDEDFKEMNDVLVRLKKEGAIATVTLDIRRSTRRPRS